MRDQFRNCDPISVVPHCVRKRDAALAVDNEIPAQLQHVGRKTEKTFASQDQFDVAERLSRLVFISFGEENSGRRSDKS
jgi:hypothetical protein